MPLDDSDPPWRTTFLVAAASLSFFLLLASGYVQTIDVAQSIAVSQRIVMDHTVSIIGFPETAGGGAVRGRDGRLYSTHDIGMAVLFLPISALDHWGVFPASVASAAYTVVNPIFGAAAVATVYRFAWRLSGNALAGVQTAFVLAGCTYLLPYARTSFDAVPVAALLVAAAYGVWRGISVGDLRRVGVAAALGGAAIVVRTDSVVILGSITLWVAWMSRRADRVRDLAVWLPPLGVAVAINGWFNWLRYGHVLDSGHRDDPQTAFTGDVLSGILGQLISPGKGVLFFAPPIVLAVVGWRRMLREHHGFGWALLAGSAAYLVLFASIANWSGADAVGPRFALPLVVLLWAPVVFVLAGWRQFGWAIRSAVVGVCVLGAVVQLGLATTADAAIARAHQHDLQARAFDSSQIVYSWQALWDGARGQPPYPAIAWDPVAGAPSPRFDLWWTGASPWIANVWPARAAAVALAIATVALWLVALRRARADDLRTLDPDM